MSLLDPPPVKQEKSRAMAFTVAALVLVAAAVLWFTFRYYPEKRAAEHFFDALVTGNTDQAYTLWKPGGNYLKKDFLADWSETGYYGPVKSFKIMGAKTPRDSNVVEVRVAISPFTPFPEETDAEKSKKTKVVNLWIQPSDKAISFSPNSY